MKSVFKRKIDAAKQAALNVVLENARKGRSGLPRTAAFGYPEPYTRDLMISSLGIATTRNEELIDSLRRTLISLAAHQSRLGLIPGLADDSEDLGPSDTTPLFLFGLSVYRQISKDVDFLGDAAAKALAWMEYQSPSDRVIVAQQPTSDWRDEQWVLGFGLYINTIVYSYLKMFGIEERAEFLKAELNKPVISGEFIPQREREGLACIETPFYALWSYKLYCNERFDLLGNSLAILSGVATRKKAESIVDFVESSCRAMREKNLLSIDLPPNFFPFIRPEDLDWRSRYQKFNNPGEYHNGGLWPFICSFYVAVLMAIGRKSLALKKLDALTDLVTKSRNPKLEFGFNEWIRAQDGAPRGEDWQLWSAAMYLYAVECVEKEATPFFDAIRGTQWQKR